MEAKSPSINYSMTNSSGYRSEFLQDKIVCVIGAGGFIGSHLVDALLAEGCRVRALSRKLPGLLDSTVLRNPNLDVFTIDIRDDKLINDTIQGADIVAHLASSTLPHNSNLNPKDDISTNLIGSINVINACINNNVKKLIYLSSGELSMRPNFCSHR